MKLFRAIRAYADNDDPLAAASNLVALMVASNQPFYPLYIYWMVGSAIAPSFLTFLSTPFFLAVPALARRSSFAGRCLLPLTGLLNTLLCIKAFGNASGVAAFLAPCIVISAIAFRPKERIAMLLFVGLSLAILMFGAEIGDALHVYTPEEYANFLRLNAFSAATLTAFVGIAFAGAIAKIEARQLPEAEAPESKP